MGFWWVFCAGRARTWRVHCAWRASTPSSVSAPLVVAAVAVDGAAAAPVSTTAKRPVEARSREAMSEDRTQREVYVRRVLGGRVWRVWM